MDFEIELEKKFLIAYPDISSLQQYHPVKYEIEQIYLLSDVGTHRIRKRREGQEVTYFETVKIRINNEKCYEHEQVISAEKYAALRQQADPSKHPIVKDRYVFPFGGKVLELDVYPFWKEKAVLEIELENEADPYAIPDEITVIKDVSDRPEYKNNYLASNGYEDSEAGLL